MQMSYYIVSIGHVQCKEFPENLAAKWEGCIKVMFIFDHFEKWRGLIQIFQLTFKQEVPSWKKNTTNKEN